jgi:hypothetical protein
MDVDVISHTGTGTYASWTVNGGGTVPLQSVEWGEVLGVLGDQSDLASALNSKLELSGGVLDANSTIQASTTTEVSVFSGSGLNVELSANPSENSVLNYGGLQVQNFSGTMAVTATGLTFPNSSTQTIAFPGFTGYAPLASPVFTGDARAVTPDTSDNDTSIATTAFVKAQGYLTSAPVTSVAGRTGAITLAVADVSGAAPVASPTLTGTPLSTTAAADTNTTQIATTAFVVGQASSTTPLADGTAAVGTSLRYARADHVHGTDTTRAAVDSQAFTGTPSLPTGTTGVTQTAGNNTTALATTAFVTAAVPAASTTVAGLVELATVGEALRPSSSTLGMTPDTTREMLMYPGYLPMYGGGVISTSGTGANGSFTFATQRWHELVGPNISTAGYSSYVFDSTFSGVGMVAMTRGVGSYSRRWNSRIWASGRSMINAEAGGYAGDANTFARVMVGGRSSVAAGGMVAGENGIGWKVAGGGSAALIMTVSNGSALTETTSSFTPTGSQVFDWKIYSDGTGNVTLWVNDTQVATSTGGPTTSTAEQYNMYMEIVDQTASATARFALYNFGTKVFWSQA